jgi:type I restriction enzyme R subunit
MSAALTAGKEQNTDTRTFTAADISEYATRKKYIDVDLKLLGWTFGDDVREEVQVGDMAGVDGQPGYADYVLYGKDGLPLAVIEAKRTSKDPNIGKQQAKLYADGLEKRYGRRPMMFTTNGFETYFWDDRSYPQRLVSGIFSRQDLEKLIAQREERKNLDEIVIDDKITDRYYQKEAIRAVCANIKQGHRKSLLVMATGTGKTRTASSLTDVLSRGGYVTNVLFLADRTALVKQAKDDF